SWRDVLRRPAAPESAEAQLAAAGSRPLDLPAATGEEFGRLATAVQQARYDRKAILKIMERVPKSERKLLPDVVVTVDGLLKRAEDLARAAHAMSGDVDQRALARLDEKLALTKREPGSAASADRRLKRFAPPAARDERRSVVALDSKLEQQNELLHRVFAASRPQGRDGEELVQLRPAVAPGHRRPHQAVGDARRSLQG